RSGAHHHGDCESVVCLSAGRVRFRFGESLERELEAGPGDFVYIPPRVVHQEISLDDAVDSIVVRDSQENVVVNVDLPASVVDER
ncbi:MAG: mannose-6-phosphate isomerase, partial [Dehalococcoidia bacterium]